MIRSLLSPCGWLLLPLLVTTVLAPAADAQLFRGRSRLFQVGPNPCSVVARDLNDDGLPEIVTADRGELADLREQRPANDELSLLIAQPGGSYVKHNPSLKTDFGPYDVAIANIDALKWPDIVVVNFHAVRHQDVMLFLNLKQEGIFNPVPFKVPDEGLGYFRHVDGEGEPLYSKPGLSALIIQDINRDGLRDLVATGYSSDVLVYLPGHADTYFDESQIKISPATGGPCSLQLADFDRDGEADVAAAMKASGQIAVFRGDGQGSFLEKTRFPACGNLPNRLKLGDVNGDGITDIAVSHDDTDDSIAIFYGDGNFKFTIAQQVELGEDLQVLEHGIRDFVLEDLNGDGRLDIAAACHASGKVILFINTSQDNSRVQSFTRETYSFEEGRPAALCAADVNGDTRPDLVVALWQANAVCILMNGK